MAGKSSSAANRGGGLKGNASGAKGLKINGTGKYKPTGSTVKAYPAGTKLIDNQIGKGS